MRAPTLLALLVPGLALAGRPSDGALWTEVEATVEATDAVDISLGEQLRLGSREGDGTEALTDLSVGFQLAKWLDLGTGYRLGLGGFDEGLSVEHRLNVDVAGSAKLQPLKLSLRERYQVRVPTAETKLKQVWRSKLAAKLKTDLPVVPHISVEPWVALGDREGAVFEKCRFEAGVEIPMGKLELDLAYRLDEPVADENDPRLHVAVVSVGWAAW